MVYHYARSLGFTRAHFEVRKDNASVWRFHERFGAVKTGETEHEFLYSLSAEDIAASLEKYSRYLPQGIRVTR
jgi:RimJ/RimL family protein N-acetyltransferase